MRINLLWIDTALSWYQSPQWMEQDALVLLWINATLTPMVLQRVVGLQSIHEV